MKEKMVRDLIPKMLFELGTRPFEIREADGEGEYTYFIWEKFYEEMKEFIDNPCIEELADIVEVALAILVNQGSEECTRQDLEDTIIYKKHCKGGFKKGYIMTLPGEGDDC